MGMYDQFATDPDLEKQGIYLEYSGFRVKVARAGGANKKFLKAVEARTKPFRRAIQTGTADRDQLADQVREAFAETVVLGWEVAQGGEWVSGIEQPDGSIAPFTVDAVKDALRALPELYDDLQEQAAKVALFRKDLLQADAGN